MDIETYQPLDIQKITLQAFEPLHALFDPALTEKQRELAETIYMGLINSAAARVCSAAEIAQTAMAVLFQVGHSCGGHTYYVTKVENLRLAKKYRAIRSKFNGCNHAELADEFGVTEMRVRQILSHKSGLERRRARGA
jgi:hypothetical protein